MPAERRTRICARPDVCVCVCVCACVCACARACACACACVPACVRVRQVQAMRRADPEGGEFAGSLKEQRASRALRGEGGGEVGGWVGGGGRSRGGGRGKGGGMRGVEGRRER